MRAPRTLLVQAYASLLKQVQEDPNKPDILSPIFETDGVLAGQFEEMMSSRKQMFIPSMETNHHQSPGSVWTLLKDV